jgi:glycosyltransferase involved in cell wall biosynthesis
MNKLGGTILWDDPIIFYAWMYLGQSDEFCEPLTDFQEINKEKNAIFLMWIAWSKEDLHGDPNYRPEKNFIEWVEKRKTLYPKHDYILVANTPLEFYQLNKSGLRTVLFNQNAFLDPNVYLYLPEVRKQYDAIYNAQLVDFKRHDLLSKTESCLLIAHGGKAEVFNKIQNFFSPTFKLENPHNLNSENELSLKGLPLNLIIESINSAKVGVCLSETEGAMHAAVEYLLCGLPVVTTWNSGGRDYFFDGRYVLNFQPKSFVVSEAIKAMISLNIDPLYIRNETIKKQKEVILRFCDFLKLLVMERRPNMVINFVDIWEKIYVNKLVQFKSTSEYMADMDRFSDYY